MKISTAMVTITAKITNVSPADLEKIQRAGVPIEPSMIKTMVGKKERDILDFSFSTGNKLKIKKILKVLVL